MDIEYRDRLVGVGTVRPPRPPLPARVALPLIAVLSAGLWTVIIAAFL